MAYDGWELGFESSRSGAGRKQWNRTINLMEEPRERIEVQNKTTDEWERGFESSRRIEQNVNKKLSHCLLNKQQVVLLDSDMIVWDR